MHTLIAYWHRLLSESEPAIPTLNVTLEEAKEQLRLWGMASESMSDDQTIRAYAIKRQQLGEMDRQFEEGEKVGEGVGLVRVGKPLEDRVGSWPAWLFEILSCRMKYDAVNKQFFYKHPDEAKILRMNSWMFLVKAAPLRRFALQFPTTTLRNVFRLGALKKTLLADVKHFGIAAIDQPEKGEDGYYHFRDDSFWEEGGH